MSTEALLVVRGLAKQFSLPSGKHVLQACQDVSFSLGRGETLGLVGESGSGKTTLGRCILRLIEPTRGEVIFEGHDLTKIEANDLRRLRRDFHMVFQDPHDSFNPKSALGDQIAGPLRLHSDLMPQQRNDRVAELLTLVGLPKAVAAAYPQSLSAGALQRCSIARAIATSPKLVVLDEPTSLLAPEAEAEVVSVLLKLHQELSISYIWVSHNLSLIGEACQRIAVMYLSQIVEIGPTERVFGCAQHPYSRALIASTLRPDPVNRREEARVRERLQGEIPSPIALPCGCYLAGRCAYVLERCRREPQTLRPFGPYHEVRCWRVAERDLVFEDGRVADPIGVDQGKR